MPRVRMSADIELSENNGVYAIRPTKDGRLKNLVEMSRRGEPKAWVFANFHPYDDPDPEVTYRNDGRDFLAGSTRELKPFLDLCRKCGLDVDADDRCFFVPMSNGTSLLEGRPVAGEKVVRGYSESEINCIAGKLPTEEVLRAALA